MMKDMDRHERDHQAKKYKGRYRTVSRKKATDCCAFVVIKS